MRRYRRSMWRRLRRRQRRRWSRGGHSMRRYRRSMRRRRRSRGVSGDIGDCDVGITLQMCNRVTNHGDMSTFSKPVSESLDSSLHAVHGCKMSITDVNLIKVWKHKCWEIKVRHTLSPGQPQAWKKKLLVWGFSLIVLLKRQIGKSTHFWEVNILWRQIFSGNARKLFSTTFI